MFDIITFGGAVVDTLIKTKTKEEKGNILIPYGSKILIKDVHFEIGGGGTNTAVAFSRLGLKTGYIGRLGNDENGNKILNQLKKENVNFLGSITNQKTSGFSIILLNQNMNRSILTYKGINDEISIKDVKPFKTKWIYFASSRGESFNTQLKLAKELKNKGVKIAFNPSEYLLRELDVKPLLKYCDVVIMNKVEASLLSKSKNYLEEIQKLGPYTVVVTNEKETIHCLNGKEFYSKVPPKTKIVDKTGAGDAFASGFVAGLIKNKSIEYCLELGVKEAVSVMKHLGAKNNLLKMRLK